MKGQHIKEEVHKTTAKALYRRGMCKSALNDTTSALVDFQMALIYMPNDKVLYFILLKFWKQQKRSPFREIIILIYYLCNESDYAN